MTFQPFAVLRRPGGLKPMAQLLAVTLAAGTLSACGFKPESKDIARDLSQIYQCPILEVADVEKVDGAERGDKRYEVAYTFTLKVKGGQEAATYLFSEWFSLEAERDQAAIDYQQAVSAAARRRQEAAMGAAGFVSAADLQNDPAVRLANMKKEQIGRRIDQLLPCEGENEITQLYIMRNPIAKDLAEGVPRIAVTTALKIQGSGGHVEGRERLAL